MVICNYFLNGSCRFGTKCMNDHVDLKTVIKQEVESSLTSKQWPLSCFGPFKEKPCLTNFIEDKSFEEVRFYCYEATKAGTLPQYSQQLGEQIKDSQNKMQSLLMMTPDIVAEIIKIYNTGVTTNPQPAATPAPSTGFGANPSVTANPFATAMAGTAGPQTAASIFGGGAAQQQPASFFGSTAPVFGQSAQASAFGQTKPSIFGQSNNTFGIPALGGGPQQQTGSSIFGQTAPQTTFGGAPAFSQTGVSGGSIFGGAAQPTQPGSIFGVAHAQTPFGGGGVVAQQSAFGGGNTSIFGGPAAQPQNAGSIFAPAAAPNQFAAPPTGGSMFGNAPQATGFQGMQQTQPTPAFGGGGSASMFTATPTAQPTFQSTNMTQSNAPPYPGSGSLFGNNQPAQQQQPPPPNDASIYSKMESLTKEQIDAFQADEFVLGQIPTVPPPREMCL